MSFSNMKMMGNKRDIRLAWQDTVNVMSSAELRKRPLTMQIHALAERAKKKNLRGSDSQLYIATCPFIYIARILGLAPYEFHENDLLAPSNINMIYSIIWLCLYTYIIYFVMMEFTFTSSEGKPTLRYTEIVKAAFNYGVLMFDLIQCLCTRKQVTEIWNGIQDYDEIVHKLGFTRNEKTSRNWIWSILAISSIIWTAISLLGMYAFSQPWVENVTYLILYVGSAASVTRFSGIVMLLGQRFNHLNEISRRNMSLKPLWMTGGTPIVDVKIIERLHSDIVVLVDKLNSVFSWSMMLWITNLSIHSISDLYFIMAWIFDNRLYWSLIVCLSAWTLSFLSQLFLINYSCHYTATKANCIGYIILEWKRQMHLRNRNMELESPIHFINRQLDFSAAGCFNINLPLLYTLVGSFTTYLVILLQFD